MIEKVYIVSAVRKPRLKTKSYVFHLSLMIPCFVVAALLASSTARPTGMSRLMFVLQLVYRVAEIRKDGACMIGFKSFGSITLLVRLCLLGP